VIKARAAVYTAYGQPLVIDEVELPDPGADHVLIKQFASGICHSQLHAFHNPAARVPSVPGHESTGIVIAKGANVTHVEEGDHVIVTWLPRHPVKGMSKPYVPNLTYRGQEVELNKGLAPTFTWTETTLAHEQYVVKMDPDVPSDVTSIIGCAVLTGCGAAKNTAAIERGDSVAVFGVGGIGLCIMQSAANLGASPLIAVDLDDEKLEFAKRFGATVTVNAAREDAVARVIELTNGGADYCFDAIGIAETMEQILAATRPGEPGFSSGGTAVMVGVPHYTTPPVLNMRDFLAEKHYIGSNGGSGRPERDFPLYVSWFKDGMLPLDELVTRRYRLEEINEAVRALDAGEVLGRSIIVFD
jgi:Zn-dependent alcohol dehydrogenase